MLDLTHDNSLILEDGPIVTHEPFLRQKSVETTIEYVKSIGLVKKIQETLKKLPEPGLGLAAIQVGFPIRAAWYRIPKVINGKVVPGTGESVTIINPEIVDKNDYRLFSGEGCLSMPGKKYNTGRYFEVTVQGVFIIDGNDGDGKVRSIVATGIEAAVLQHELDHFDGILCKDKEREYKKAPKIGRNDKCPCGSDKKYKKCCLLKG